MSPLPEVAGDRAWVELVVSMLLILSGVLVVTGAFGLLRLKDFFQRMHPVALGTTLGTWSACAASIVYFSMVQHGFVVHAWLIPILLAVTVPMTTLLLARAALLRRRFAGMDIPPPLAASGQGHGEDSPANPAEAARPAEDA